MEGYGNNIKKVVFEPGMKWYWFKMYVQIPLAMIGYVILALSPLFFLFSYETAEETVGSLILSPIYLLFLVIFWIALHKMRTFAKGSMSWIYSVIWIPVGLSLFGVWSQAVVSGFSAEVLIANVLPIALLLIVALLECKYFQKRKFLFGEEQVKKHVKRIKYKRYRIGDDISGKAMVCNWCKHELSGRLRYCKKCGRTYCVDCGIQICKCGGEVADAPEEV